jgi:hypothetical protein
MDTVDEEAGRMASAAGVTLHTEAVEEAIEEADLTTDAVVVCRRVNGGAGRPRLRGKGIGGVVEEEEVAESLGGVAEVEEGGNSPRWRAGNGVFPSS